MCYLWLAIVLFVFVVSLISQLLDYYQFNIIFLL